MSTSTVPTNQRIGMFEFIFLIASLMSIVALSIDAVLPALGYMAVEFNVSTSDIQLVLTSLFAGFAIGQLIYGPLSDSIGRLACIYAGMLLFVIGCVVSLLAQSLEILVLGRFLQGLGAAGPRIMVSALARDCFAGRTMARVMSFAATVFMLVPILAPMIGQLVLWVAPWQYIFVMYIVLALLMSIWTYLRLNETLPVADRRPLQFSAIWQAARLVLTHRQAAGYTLVSGLVFGGFLGYLSSSQVLFQEIYGVGDAFPLYFSLLVLPNVVSSLLNARLVIRWGMYRLVQLTNVGVLTTACALYYYASLHDGIPPLNNMLAFLFVMFAGIGLQFGNLNALAMEPLGKVAGMAATIFGAGSTLVSIPIGAWIGMSVTSNILPLSLGMAVTAAVGVVLMHWVRFGWQRPTANGGITS